MEKVTENLIRNQLNYLINEGFVKVIIDGDNIERYRLKTKKELLEEIEELE